MPGISIEFDEDIVSFNFDRKTAYVTTGRWVGDDTRFDVKSSPVPGTGQDFSIDVLFAQRSSHMRASVVNCIECPVHIEQRNALALDVHRFALSGSQFGCL